MHFHQVCLALSLYTLPSSGAEFSFILFLFLSHWILPIEDPPPPQKKTTQPLDAVGWDIQALSGIVWSNLVPRGVPGLLLWVSAAGFPGGFCAPQQVVCQCSLFCWMGKVEANSSVPKKQTDSDAWAPVTQWAGLQCVNHPELEPGFPVIRLSAPLPAGWQSVPAPTLKPICLSSFHQRRVSIFSPQTPAAFGHLVSFIVSGLQCFGVYWLCPWYFWRLQPGILLTFFWLGSLCCFGYSSLSWGLKSGDLQYRGYVYVSVSHRP